jgi:deoxyribodipyrimidine photo-lyase
VEAIYMSADVSPYAARRHERLAKACATERIALHRHGGPSVIAPGTVTPTGGDHYRVFTPYWRRWNELPLPPPAPTPRRIPTPREAGGGRIPTVQRITSETASPELIRGGESEGRARLTRWLNDGLEVYARQHDALALDMTSHLSAFLHFGCLSARTVRERASQNTGSEDFVRQLCWRDFHHQVLAARPDLPVADYRPRGDKWRRDKRAREAWSQGLTGYPIVDAGMRELWATGYMHNRVRMIAASFLVKHLLIDWRRGESWFWDTLCDADPANNAASWQWVAGSGADAAPYFRIFNPVLQGQKFDPEGGYVRRWVPELARLEPAHIHSPWLAPSDALAQAGVEIGRNYPAPIVDHAFARRRALEALSAIKS